MRKFNLFVCIITIMLMITINQKIVSANVENNPSILYSHTFIDIQEIEINQKQYHALLNNDAIHIISDDGRLVKTINYFIDESIGNDFQEEDYEFKVIHDIDQLGSPDFLISYKDKTLYTISYENNSVIWKYTPKMTSAYPCGTLRYCKLALEITHFEIYDDLYLSAGYLFQKININTGKVKEEYIHNNNIWTFTKISDVNQNKQLDFVLAAQASKLVFVDGSSLHKIREMNIIEKDIYIETLDVYIKPNIWSLTFIQKNNTLVATSEDGYVHEMNVSNESTDSIKKQQLFSYYEDEYMKLIEQGKGYEKTIKDGKTYYSFHPNDLPRTKIYQTTSFDSNDINDYIIVYQPMYATSGNYTFSKCSQDNLCEEKQFVDKRLVDVNDKILVYQVRDDFTIVNLETNEDILSSYDPLFDIPLVEMKSPPFHEQLTFNVFLVNDDIFVNYHQQKLYKFKSNSPDNPIWTMPIATQIRFLKTENRLIILHGKEMMHPDLGVIKTVTGFTVVNEMGENIYTYSNPKYPISNYQIMDDKLYFLIEDLFVYKLTVVDLMEGKVLIENDISKTIETIIGRRDLNIQVLDNYYVDVTGDGIREVIVLIQYIDGLTLNQELIIYDMKNGEILGRDKVDFTSIENISLYPDMNGDELPEILYFHNDMDNHIQNFDIYQSNTRTYFNNEDRVHYEFPLEDDKHYLLSQVDLNNDGYDELIFDHTNATTNRNEDFNFAYIIDLASNKRILFKNSSSLNASVSSYNFLRTEEDLNHDGIKEIITLEAKFPHEPQINLLPYKFRIFNYEDGKLVEKFNLDITTLSFIGKTTHPQIATFKDLNHDGVDEIIFNAFDQEYNTQIEIYDFETNKLVYEYCYNMDTETEGVILDNDQKYYHYATLESVLNKDYLFLSFKGNRSNLYPYLNLSTFETDYLLNFSFEGEFHDKFIFYDEMTRTFVLSEPLNQEMITIKKDKNTYYFQVDDELDVKSIEIISQKDTYPIYTTNKFSIQIPDGDYSFVFKITLKDGGVYYYYDQVTVSDDLTKPLLNTSMLIISMIPILFISRFLINRKYRV